MTEERMGAGLWPDVTWTDLEMWLGSTILGRGQKYHRNDRVVDLARTDDDTLTGRVAGTDLYLTSVMATSGAAGVEFSYTCTCPYWAPCKHAAAVVLEYLDRLKSGESVPSELRSIPGASDTILDGRVAGVSRGDRELMRAEYLDSLSRDELIALIDDLTDESVEAAEALMTRVMLTSGDTAEVVAEAREEMLRVTSEPGWYDWNTRTAHTPDFTRLTQLLERLVEAGQADEVVRLGEELFTRGTEQVMHSQDEEGETAIALTECLVPVWRALDECSLDPAERLLWLIDRTLEDEFELTYYTDEHCDAWEAGQEAWSHAADDLLGRLRELGDPGDNWSAQYERQQLTNWVISALENAGRDADALACALEEAPRTNAYERAFRLLRKVGRDAEARALAEEGIRATRESRAGIARALEERLREMALEDGPDGFAAAFAAQDFLGNPSLAAYRELRDQAEALGVWETVRRLVLQALETGDSPTAHPEWPLPEVELPECETEERINAPETRLLIEIALDEDDPERVMRWYRRLREEDSKMKNAWHWNSGSIDARVAHATCEQFPDEAIAIWDTLARAEIDRTKRSAYEESLRYLRPMQALLRKLGREDEWEAYLRALREEHSRKRALQETLDRLDPRPIAERGD